MTFSVVYESENTDREDIEELSNLGIVLGCEASVDNDKVAYQFRTRKQRDDFAAKFENLLKNNLELFNSKIITYFEPEYSTKENEENVPRLQI